MCLCASVLCHAGALASSSLLEYSAARPIRLACLFSVLSPLCMGCGPPKKVSCVASEVSLPSSPPSTRTTSLRIGGELILPDCPMSALAFTLDASCCCAVKILYVIAPSVVVPLGAVAVTPSRPKRRPTAAVAVTVACRIFSDCNFTSCTLCFLIIFALI